MNQNFDPDASLKVQNRESGEQKERMTASDATPAAETRSMPCLNSMRPGLDGQDPRLSVEEAWNSAQKISRRVEDSFHAQHGRYPDLTAMEDFWLLAEHLDVGAEQELAPCLAWYEIAHSLVRNFMERSEQGLFADLDDQQRTLVFDAIIGRIRYSPPAHELDWQLTKLNILVESDAAEVVINGASAFAAIAERVNQAATAAYQRKGSTFLYYQFADAFFKPISGVLLSSALVCKEGLAKLGAKLNEDLVRSRHCQAEAAGYSYYK